MHSSSTCILNAPVAPTSINYNLLLNWLCSSISVLFTGVGAKKSPDEDWIGHQEAFDSILARLNSHQCGGIGGGEDSGDALDEPLTAKPLPLLSTAVESKRTMYGCYLVLVYHIYIYVEIFVVDLISHFSRAFLYKI